MQEIHNFLQRFFCFFLTCHIQEGHTGLLLFVHLCIGLSYTHDSAAAHTAGHTFQEKSHHKINQCKWKYPWYNEFHNHGIRTLIIHLPVDIGSFQFFLKLIPTQYHGPVGKFLTCQGIPFFFRINENHSLGTYFYFINFTLLKHGQELAVLYLLSWGTLYNRAEHGN